MKKLLLSLLFVMTLSMVGCVQAQTPVVLRLEWTAVGDDGGVGRAESYDFRYSTDSLVLINDWNNATEISQTIVPLDAGTLEVFTTTLPLDSETHYYFAVKVSDESGNTSGISNISDLLTPDIIPPNAIITLRIMLQ